MLSKSRFIEMFGRIGYDDKKYGLTALDQFCKLNPNKKEINDIDDTTLVSFIPMANVSESGDIKTSDLRQIIDVKKGFSYFKNGDVLFAKITPCMENGKGAVACNLHNGIGFGTTEFHVIRPDIQKCLPEWIYFVTVSKEFRKEAAENMTGSAGQKRVPAKYLESFKIGLPSISLQKEFVSFVHQIDKSKFILQQMIEKLELLKKSRFIEMFGDINSKDQIWTTQCLDKNAELINGKAYSQDELLDQGKYKVLRVGNFFSNKGWYFSDLELDPDKYCENGDLLFAWSASFGAKIWNEEKVIYHYHIWKIKVGHRYDKQFLCYLLNEKVESLKKDTHGSTMLHLTKQKMEKTKFIVPPISLQTEYINFSNQIDKSKLVLQKALENLVGKV
ncbi:EcoKI restriction-modification system protein HsdS [Anaerobiospirillum thomasii]|uniref:restriction endonuclease subunit S n=1 Tax=Anaerobiospirillum thomasii TaxID=179995 RepID=UPI000D9E3F15|nr:restriction endonuclease subunit S [Anaerobiospirillum thomasii]SPT67982.1 EcoKI restriction-modification system protein HsdS [Anaerobiospirillum thomasii]